MNTWAYAAWVALGAAAGLWLSRALERLRAKRQSTLPIEPRHGRALRGAALLGAVMGAYLFEWPADVFGWTAEALHGAVWGGRTVLGGVIGGWLTLELVKGQLGLTASTGTTFTAPLALAFGIGRLGCHWGGCCQGRLFDATSRWPVPLMESGLDFAFAVLFALPAVERRLGNRLFPSFIALWALMRFALEFLRENPSVMLGLSYYQWLAQLLFAAAAAVWWRRGAVHLDSAQ